MELCNIFDTAQPGMSHHLKILLKSNLLQTRREGNSIFYRRAFISSENPLSHLMTSLFNSIDRIVLSPDIIRRCQQVHKDRAQRSREFFRKNADRLKENQDLIAEFSHYAACITDLLSNEHLPDDGRVIEVGPGECDLIGTLSGTFCSVLAVDNAQEMLDRTREKVRDENLPNVEYFLGELSDLQPSQRAAPNSSDLSGA